MAQPARFLFDQDFGRPEPVAPPVVVAPPEPPRPTVDLEQHLAELVQIEERARAEAYAEGREDGFSAGRLDAEARAAERLADAAHSLVGTARALLADLEAARLEAEAEAVELALAAARSLARTLVEREPLAEIRALLVDCLGPLRRAPHLVVRLPAADADALEHVVGRIARESGFDGRIVILGEDDVGRGDCRIEWADGGIVRDTAAVDARIDETVRRWLEGRRGALGRGSDPFATDGAFPESRRPDR